MATSSSSTDPPVILRYCATCSAVDAPNQCGKCRLVNYCNRECQKKDWTKHKTYCSETRSRSSIPVIKKPVIETRPVKPPILVNSNGSCLHGAPATNPRITEMLPKVTQFPNMVVAHTKLLQDLSKKEIRHLSEALRSMAVDASLDAQWATAGLFWKLSQELALYNKYGVSIFDGSSPKTPEQQKDFYEMFHNIHNPDDLLISLRKSTFSVPYCYCLCSVDEMEMVRT
jgi:hypothetical protein